ncbi:MAG TPA: peptidase, partial [Firmicutes bacterium]|nr:peptidase [Bacillota bacterium]
DTGQFLMSLGIWLFAGAVAFQLITLPVEFNASRRALTLLADGGHVTQDEVPAVRAVLQAAALTYVAASAVAVTQLLRLLILRGSRRD